MSYCSRKNLKIVNFSNITKFYSFKTSKQTNLLLGLPADWNLVKSVLTKQNLQQHNTAVNLLMLLNLDTHRLYTAEYLHMHPQSQVSDDDSCMQNIQVLKQMVILCFAQTEQLCVD